jgi:hypothetical protein
MQWNAAGGEWIEQASPPPEERGKKKRGLLTPLFLVGSRGTLKTRY